jgi:hypothetical protein
LRYEFREIETNLGQEEDDDLLDESGMIKLSQIKKADLKKKLQVLVNNQGRYNLFKEALSKLLIT